MNKNLVITILIIALVGLAAYVAYPYLQPKEPTTGEKIDKAMDELSKGVEGAAKAIEGK